MLKWKNIAAVSLIGFGALGFKWGNSIRVIFQSPNTHASYKQLASSVSEKVSESVLAPVPAAFFVELFSLGMLITGVAWLVRRANNRQPNSRLVLDFSTKKMNRGKYSRAKI